MVQVCLQLATQGGSGGLAGDSPADQISYDDITDDFASRKTRKVLIYMTNVPISVCRAKCNNVNCAI